MHFCKIIYNLRKQQLIPFKRIQLDLQVHTSEQINQKGVPPNLQWHT